MPNAVSCVHDGAQQVLYWPAQARTARTGPSERNVPMTGIFRINPRATGKKSPNKFRKPQPSMHIPTIAQPYSTSAIPPKKHAVPFHFRFWKKKRYVFPTPIISTTPAMKSNCATTCGDEWPRDHITTSRVVLAEYSSAHFPSRVDPYRRKAARLEAGTAPHQWQGRSLPCASHPCQFPRLDSTAQGSYDTYHTVDLSLINR